ncbi:MAG: hypothetical protein ACRBFS_10850 [Aureispira sp.]
MGKFIIETILFSILVITGYLFIAHYAPISKDDYHGFSYSYMAGIKLKHQRAQAITSPKIVFVGGSNLAYGMDSEMIEKAFSIPVVNLGLHGGLGVPFMLKETQKLLKKGDIVFISIEYFTGDGDYRLIQQTCLEFPEVADIEQFNIKQEIQLHLNETRQGLVDLVENKPKKDEYKNKLSIWEMENKKRFDPSLKFNKYGDFTKHLDHDGWYQRRSDDTKFQYRYWEGIQLLNDFKAKNEGVSFFFIYPSLAKSNFDAHKTILNKFHKDLINNLDFEVLNTPEDFVFEDKLFYDTYYHLIRQGRHLRTKKQIQSFMKNERVQKSVKKALQAQSIDSTETSIQ